MRTFGATQDGVRRSLETAEFRLLYLLAVPVTPSSKKGALADELIRYEVNMRWHPRAGTPPLRLHFVRSAFAKHLQFLFTGQFL